jgi:hypothetical protein
MKPKFLFVSGCPRSGTTVLAHILNWSHEAFVGLERFASLLKRNPSMFSPQLFEKSRLLHFEPGDCGYSSYEAKADYSAWFVNPFNADRLDRLELVGDKITNLYSHFDQFSSLPWNSSEITILHIVRNVADVAASYQTRMLEPSDGWNMDYIQAIDDWSESVNRVHAFVSQPATNVRLCVVNYDSIFIGDFDRLINSAMQIYSFVGLEFGEKQVEGMRLILEAGAHYKKIRQSYDNIQQVIISQMTNDDVLTKYSNLVGQALC